MYVARLNVGGKVRYVIRESVVEPGSNHFVSRDLYDLGEDPSRFIIYGDRDSFYIDPSLEDELGGKRQGEGDFDLEELFLPFVNQAARRYHEDFSNKYRNYKPQKLSPTDAERIRDSIHLFDKRRLYYLRYGSLSEARLHAAPLKMFRPLLDKSRDELEQLFGREEQVLEGNEFRQYVYVIFQLERFFTETAARVMPEALDQERLAEVFEEEFCLLFDDPSFRAGLDETPLQQYLSRYLVMFFDYEFPAGSFLDDYIRQFMNQHRNFSFPEEKVAEAYSEAAGLFGVSEEELRQTDKRGLTALYRKLAHEHHPDKGGEQEDFVKLTEVYQRIINGKK